MTSAFPATIRAAVAETMATDQVPGLAVGIVRAGQAPAYHIAGADAAGQPLTMASLVPVASITKLATALAILRLADAGVVTIDAPVKRYLPDAISAAAGITLRDLLRHTSGLPYDLPEDAAPYRWGLDWPTLARACLQTPLAWPPNTRVQYSNVGYGLLAIVVERQTNQAFAVALEDLVVKPLGVEAYLGVEPPRSPAVIADVRSPQTGTPLEPFNSAFWRSLALPWGGLLTTVAGALALARAYCGQPAGFLRPETLAEATMNQTDDLAGGLEPPLLWPHCPWGLGPEIRDAKTPHWAPSRASPASFGHAGSSGAVAWADPSAGVAWAIVGTRTMANGWLVRGGPTIGTAILTSGDG